MHMYVWVFVYVLVLLRILFVSGWISTLLLAQDNFAIAAAVEIWALEICFIPSILYVFI